VKLDVATTCLVFPGQGSQFVGMGKELAQHHAAARRVFDQADGVLGIRLSGTMWEGPQAVLDDTINTQPALFVHSMAAMAVLQEMWGGGLPAYMAGHSLGELSAICASGGLDSEHALRLVRRRGELMKLAGERSPGRMAAILSLDTAVLGEICKQASTAAESVTVANDNCPGQVVISGAEAAVERAVTAAKGAGAKRAVTLAVSIAAHSPLMGSIQREWDGAVDAAPFGPLRSSVIGNVTAEPLRDAEQAKTDLKAQMQSQVRWTETIQWLARAGIRRYIELGSGNVLSGLIRRIDKEASTLQLGTPQDVAALA
jgi:[acyl-carrier-protein] S-malonyltransferase